MVPWLRPQRMRDVSVVMIAEAMMRAISAISAKPSTSFNLHLPGHLHLPDLHLPGHRGRNSVAADHKPSPRDDHTSGSGRSSGAAGGEPSSTSEIHRDHLEAASASAEGHISEVELCTTDDPSRVRLVFPAPDSQQQTVELYCSASNPGAAEVGPLAQSELQREPS